MPSEGKRCLHVWCDSPRRARVNPFRFVRCEVCGEQVELGIALLDVCERLRVLEHIAGDDVVRMALGARETPKP